MGGLLGWLAGCGMLILIGILLLLILRDLRVLSSDTARRTALLCMRIIAVGGLYLAALMLLRQAVYQDVDNASVFTLYLPGGYWQQVGAALDAPRWLGPLTGPFVYAGHFLGKALFSQYLSGGWMLAFGLSCLSYSLIHARLRERLGERAAADVTLLLLCLPSAVFCFLPGWPPVAAALLATLFFFLGRLIPKKDLSLPRPALTAATALGALLSAFTVAGLALGRIG